MAWAEIVSRGNKASRRPFQEFLNKACEILEHRIHLLILDLQPPTARDPQGIHGAIWDEVAGEEYARPLDKPLTMAAYESGDSIRAFIEKSFVCPTPAGTVVLLLVGGISPLTSL